MRIPSLLLPLAALALAASACPPASASVPPLGLTAFAVHSGDGTAPDTLFASFVCPVAGPNTACAATYNAGASVAVTAPASVNVGATATIAVVCPSPGANVTLTVTVAGVAPGVANSATTSQSVSGSCAYAAAVTPVFTLTPFVTHAGH